MTIKRLWRPKASNPNGRSIGAEIENKAARWLERKGLKLVERNYHCRSGEIDLIMLDADSIIFVEVRFRSKGYFGDGLESVDWRKQEKLRKAATHYLANRPTFTHCNCQFDVLAAKPKEGADEPDWQWVRNAF